MGNSLPCLWFPGVLKVPVVLGQPNGITTLYADDTNKNCTAAIYIASTQMLVSTVSVTLFDWM